MAPLWTFTKLNGSHRFDVISATGSYLRRTQPAQSHDYRTEQRPLECSGHGAMPRVVASAQPGQWSWKKGVHVCGIPRCFKGREFKDVSTLPFSVHGLFHLMFTLHILSYLIYCPWEQMKELSQREGVTNQKESPGGLTSECKLLYQIMLFCLQQWARKDFSSPWNSPLGLILQLLKLSKRCFNPHNFAETKNFHFTSPFLV